MLYRLQKGRPASNLKGRLSLRDAEQCRRHRLPRPPQRLRQRSRLPVALDVVTARFAAGASPPSPADLMGVAREPAEIVPTNRRIREFTNVRL